MDEIIYRWIADYSLGVIGREDFEQLKVWIETSPQNRVMFEETLRFYKEGREIGFQSWMDEESSWRSLERKLGRRKRLVWTRWVVAASILLAGIVGGGVLLLPERENVSEQVFSEIPGKATVILRMADGKSVSLNKSKTIGLVEKDGTKIHKDTMNRLIYEASNTEEKSVLHTVEVPVGGEFDMVLADGTRVWLNSATKLRYPTRFTGKNREVYVEGEAFFSVCKDSFHPFIVHTEGGHVRVLGTEFNLSAYPGERTITTLAEGKVEVNDKISKVCLKPGEQAICTKGARFIEVKDVDVSLFTSWVKGVFEFENMSLLAISRQLSRWYGVSFQFEDEDCAERCFTGGIKKYVPLNQSLDILEKTTNVVFKVSGRQVFVKSLKNEI